MAFWLRTIFRTLSTVFSVTLLAFLILRIIPGDPVELILGESASNVSRSALRADLGLDSSLSTQLLHFITKTYQGDLGVSIASHRPVIKILFERFPSTLLLALVALGTSAVIGVSYGAYAAQAPLRSRFQKLFLFLAPIFSATPVFWLAPLLVYAFSLHAPWLPVASFREWSGLVLPTICLATGISARIALLTRVSVLECVNKDYVRTAYAKGASPRRALFKHVLPNAAVPIIAVILLQLGGLLAGAVIIETVFDWPGIGKLLFEAILARDYPVVQGVVLLTSFIYATTNQISEVIQIRFLPTNNESAPW